MTAHKVKTKLRYGMEVDKKAHDGMREKKKGVPN
jgi:hypothetical protein